MKNTIKLAALAGFTLTSTSQAAITVVDHHTFNDNAQPAGTTVVGVAPTYSGGSMISAGGGLTQTVLALSADNWGIEVILSLPAATGSFFGVLAADGIGGTLNDNGIVTYPTAVSAHHGGDGDFGNTAQSHPFTDLRLAIVQDAGTRTFYINGVAAGTTAATADLSASSLEMGHFGGGGLLTGSINEVRTFTFAPSAFDTSDLLTVATVPEPSSTALLGLGGLALILRRRK
jgi:hypothetical protein